MTHPCCDLTDLRLHLLASSLSIPLYFLCAVPLLLCVLFLLLANYSLRYYAQHRSARAAELAEAQLRLIDLEQTIESLEVPIALHRGDLTVLQKLTYQQLCAEEERMHRAVSTVRELKDVAMRKQLEVTEGLCAVCSWNQFEVLFLPCRHLCCCNECAPKVADCPVCKRTILRYEKIFM